MHHNFTMLSILTLRLQKFLVLKIVIIGKINTKYFHNFVIKIDTFNATDYHLNPIQDTNTHNFTFCVISFNPEKFDGVFSSLIILLQISISYLKIHV